MSILTDIRFGLKMLARSPGFTLAAVVAIALGIGVNGMMFTIYNAALFKTLPFENPWQIVLFMRNRPGNWKMNESTLESGEWKLDTFNPMGIA